MLLSSLASSSMFAFASIWAIERLGAPQTRVGVAFAATAALAAVGAFVGGRVSDRIGRRPVIVTGLLATACIAVTMGLIGDHVWPGLALIALSGLSGGLTWTGTAAIVPDLVPPEELERGYAATRVASNIGITAGPVLGATLLYGGWTALFWVGALLLAGAAVFAALTLPLTGRPDHEPEEQGSTLRLILCHPLSLALFVAIALSWVVYNSFELLLPISLTQSHDIDRSTWGFLLALNPLLVALFQLRITRRLAHVPVGPKLGAGMLLMGLPFLLLDVSASLAVIAFCIVVFVVGEMLWVPASQAIVAGSAPADSRGAYIGAFGAAYGIGNGVAPLIGLQVRDADRRRGHVGRDRHRLGGCRRALPGGRPGDRAPRRRRAPGRGRARRRGRRSCCRRRRPWRRTWRRRPPRGGPSRRCARRRGSGATPMLAVTDTER